MTEPPTLRWKLRTLAAALLIPPLLYLLPLHRLAPRLGRGRPRPAGAPPVQDLAEWVDRLLRRLPPPWRWTCLKRAAVLYALLRKAGVELELRIGVRRDPAGSLAGHAWLVREGHPFLEQGDEHLGAFQVIASFPESTPSLL